MNEALELAGVMIVTFILFRFILTTLLPTFLHNSLRDITYEKEKKKRNKQS
jgi:hypothetical protein